MVGILTREHLGADALSEPQVAVCGNVGSALAPFSPQETISLVQTEDNKSSDH